MVPLEQACHLQSWVSSLLAFWEKFVSSLPFDFQHKVKGSCYFPWAMQDVHLRTQEQIHFKGWLQAEEKWHQWDIVHSFHKSVLRSYYVILLCAPFHTSLPPAIHSLPVSLCQQCAVTPFFQISKMSFIFQFPYKLHIPCRVFPNITTKLTAPSGPLAQCLLIPALHTPFNLLCFVISNLCISLSSDDFKFTELKGDSISVIDPSQHLVPS